MAQFTVTFDIKMNDPIDLWTAEYTAKQMCNLLNDAVQSTEVEGDLDDVNGGDKWFTMKVVKVKVEEQKSKLKVTDL